MDTEDTIRIKKGRFTIIRKNPKGVFPKKYQNFIENGNLEEKRSGPSKTMQMPPQYRKSRFRVINVVEEKPPSSLGSENGPVKYTRSRFAVTNALPITSSDDNEPFSEKYKKIKNSSKYHSLPKDAEVMKIENGRLTIRPVSPMVSLSRPVSKKSTVTYKTGKFTFKRYPGGKRVYSVGGMTSKRKTLSSKRRSKRYKKNRIV
jgi:hypothetical protein